MPHIILTPGDPDGIGPEITVKALQRLGEFPGVQFTVIGSAKALEKAAGILKMPLPKSREFNQSEDGVVPLPLREGLGEGYIKNEISDPPPAKTKGLLKKQAQVFVSSPTGGEGHHRTSGNESAQIHYIPIEAALPGTIAYQAIDAAVRMIAEKKADALVTGPISKRNLIDAGYQFPGHTEILEDMAQKYFGAKDARAEMLFVYKKLRMMLLTRHIALKDVPEALAKQGAIARPIKTLISFLRSRLNVAEPHIAMLGVNPHSGEVGGDEESKLLGPVMKAVNAIGNTKLAGPFAADGFFRTLDVQNNPYDTIVAAYHDQGLIPFKMLAGYEAVNVTIGLPFIRTSVSHGTANDIAGRDNAREDSLIAALHVALELL